MVQLGADLECQKPIDLPYKNEIVQYKDISSHQHNENKTSLHRSQIKHFTPTRSSICAWRAMLERSNKRIEKYNNAYIEVGL